MEKQGTWVNLLVTSEDSDGHLDAVKNRLDAFEETLKEVKKHYTSNTKKANAVFKTFQKLDPEVMKILRRKIKRNSSSGSLSDFVQSAALSS